MRRIVAGAALWLAAFAALADLPLTGRVMDRADVLSESMEARLTDQLAAHEAATSNQVVVLTLSTLDGETVEGRALALARGWQLGQADKDNGVLLLISMAERKVRIEVGYGLEGVLPDAIAASIIRHHITPPFKRGNFDAGVEAGVVSILAAIGGEYQVAERAAGDSDEGPPFLFWLVVAFIAFQFFWPLFFPNVGGRKRRGGRYYGGSWGGGGFSGGGGGFGGGGFGGGGGGFGGGGASGGW